MRCAASLSDLPRPEGCPRPGGSGCGRPAAGSGSSAARSRGRCNHVGARHRGMRRGGRRVDDGLSGRRAGAVMGGLRRVAVSDHTSAPGGGVARFSARQSPSSERSRLVSEVDRSLGMADLRDLVRSRAGGCARGLSAQCPNGDQAEEHDRQPDRGSPPAHDSNGARARGHHRLWLRVRSARERDKLIRRRHPAPEVDGHRSASTV
jgi:hypothetical protein